MLQRPLLPTDPINWLAATRPDVPVHFFSPVALRDRLCAFQDGFPGMVTYAVKANPSRLVLSELCAGGIEGFDVASPQEIATIRKICPGAVLHYNNPVRSTEEIAAGIAAGVASWSVDDRAELDKLIAAGIGGEVAVRFKLPVAGAHYDFGAKFGAEEAEAVALLSRVATAGLTPALTFHVGTQCGDPEAYATYLAAAARIARAAGVQVARVNVGGGFPSARNGQPLDLTPYFDAIRGALAHFETPPALVCEPGRGLVADSFAYAVRVKSLRSGRAYLNDGIYGGLSEFPSMVLPAFRVFAPEGTTRAAASTARIVFGPTCDSLDQLPAPLDLPGDLAEGDYILFGSMGAYLTGVTTRFNGYGARDTVEVARL
ncbi:type III PLP-dependent enzyme [Marivivens marinus]|uniref:type III PLP-dependent enzyme n=1 Tax=Marivivens marinus TaxID=3110173 RepID=UPI003B848A17